MQHLSKLVRVLGCAKPRNPGTQFFCLPKQCNTYTRDAKISWMPSLEWRSRPKLIVWVKTPAPVLVLLVTNLRSFWRKENEKETIWWANIQVSYVDVMSNDRV